MARPQKKEHEKLTAILRSRCTPLEKQLIQAKAKSAGLTESAYLRSAAIKAKIDMPVASTDFAVSRELRYVGNNLNQLTKLFHSTGGEPPELRATLTSLDQVLQKIIGDNGS